MTRCTPAAALGAVFALALAGQASADHPVQPPSAATLGKVGPPWTLPAQRKPVEAAQEGESWPANVRRPECGPGSLPETGLQGQVPLADQSSGRSEEGYRCNLEQVGQYAGEGAAIMMAWHGDCAYMPTGYTPTDPQWLEKRGTVVVDASDPANPKATARLDTPGMINPWEALKAHEGRGLLATGEGGSFPLAGPGSPGPHFDIYDVGSDCKQPKLLASTELPDALGHEGDFAPDGQSYYQSTYTAAPGPGIVVVDVSNPSEPKQLAAYPNPVEGSTIHAVSFSPDGKRGYFMGSAGPPNPTAFNGLEIVDISEIQERRPKPEIKLIGKVGWSENILTQIARLVQIDGHPYVFTTDEFGAATAPADACQAGKPPYGFVHVIDVADERKPEVINTLRLEVNDPANCDQVLAEQNAPFSLMYSSHYCDADDPKNTTAIACSWLSSGTRVFDVRDPLKPREIAYYNPGGRSDTTRGNSPFFEVLLGSRTKDATPSQTRWRRGENGEQQLWTMSSLGGVHILRFTNGSYPLPPLPCIGGLGAAKGRELGPARLRRKRSAQRALMAGRTRRTRGRLDRYCVADKKRYRIGYRRNRRAAVIVTSSSRFSVAGIEPGAKVSAMRKAAKPLIRKRIGRTIWFAGGRERGRFLFKTRAGRVLEGGIANRRLTRGKARLERFVRSWRGL